MTERTAIFYSRIAAEGVAIVLSILLAFAIDAAWDQRQERQRERAALNSLAADFADTRERIAAGISTHEEFRDSAKALLEMLDQQRQVADPVIMDSRLNDVFIDAKTIEVSNGSLDALFASGNLGLIENKELRTRLAAWPSLVENATEDERWIVNDLQQRLIPYLNGKVRARNTYRYSAFLDEDMLESTIPPGQSPDYAMLLADPVFENLVTNRLSNELYALAEMRVLAAEVERIQALIRRELE